MTSNRAGRREWIGLAVIALPCLLYSMDLTVLNLALPRLSADLQPSSSELLWIVDIYGFLVAGLLIPMGTLGDRIGRRRLLLIGAAAFGVTSVIAAYSTSAEMLIGARAILGAAGATLAPSTLSLIRNMFHDPRQRTVAISIWVMSYSLGAAVGPPLGGVLLEYFWWGSVFLISVPVMVLLLVTGPILLPEFRDPTAGRPDLTSALMSLVAVLTMIFGLKKIAEQGVGWLPLASIVTGAMVGAAFLRRQRRLADPLVDLRLFRSAAFSASLTVYLLATFVGFGTFVFIAQYLQLVLGLSPLQAGLWTMPSAGGFIVGSLLTPILARSMRPAYLMAGALAVSTIGFAMLSQVNPASGLPLLVAGSLVYSLGLSPVVALATDLIVGAAPPEGAGAASAISETSSELGGALGIAVIGSIGTVVYRSELAERAPLTVPPTALEAARSTLGAAVEQAGRLPPEAGAQLLDGARSAFSQAFDLIVLLCAGVTLAIAILALVWLREVPRSHSGALASEVAG